LFAHPLSAISLNHPWFDASPIPKWLGYYSIHEHFTILHDVARKAIQTRKQEIDEYEEPKDLVDFFLRKIKFGKHDEESPLGLKYGEQNLRGTMVDFMFASSGGLGEWARRLTTTVN